MKLIILLTVTLVAFAQLDCARGNDIDKLLQKLQQAVDEAVAKARAKLEDAKAQVTKAAELIEQDAQSAMQGVEDELKKELDALKEKAKDAHVNIDDCLGADEQKLVNLPTEGTNDMVNCVAGKINQAFDHAEKALDKIQNVVDEIANIRQEVKDCGHGIHAIKCLAKLAIKIEEDVVSLPTKIEAEAAATAALIINMKQEVKKCAENAENKVENDGKSTLARIAACVAKHIITH